MASRLLVECIQRTDRQGAHERIKAIGGGLPGCRWKHAQQYAVMWIEDGTFEYYVVNEEEKIINLIVAESQSGQKYLKTEADGEQPHQLMKLPECP